MRILGILLIAGLLFGCSDNTTSYVQHDMIVSPMSLIFQRSDSVKYLSITHTCTCPFNWYCTETPADGVIKYISGYGDNTNVPIQVVDRSAMTSDSLHTSIIITSNGYGTDTVAVTVIK